MGLHLLVCKTGNLPSPGRERSEAFLAAQAHKARFWCCLAPWRNCIEIEQDSGLKMMERSQVDRLGRHFLIGCWGGRIQTHSRPALQSSCHVSTKMSGAIEAVYIFNQHEHVPIIIQKHRKLTRDPSECILERVYRSRPASAKTLLPLYLRHPAPRPSLIHLPDINPSTILFSLPHANLLFLSPSSSDVEPLFVLEFLHRIVDVLEEFIGAPLLSSRIEGSYDVVAQLMGEMCDAGSVCNTEPNALRDDVDIPSWMEKLIGMSLPKYALDPNLQLTIKTHLCFPQERPGFIAIWGS